MAVPNMLAEVERCKRKFPQAWADAHTGNANTEGFIRILAADLHLVDAKFGLNGKRGNPNDISDDAINYFGEGPGHDPTHGNTPVTVIDVIGAAGSPAAVPQWAVIDQPGPGAWVKPMPVVVNPPTPEPPHVCPPCPPVPPTFDYPDENTTGKAFQARVKQAYTDANRPFPDPNDSDAFRHFMRYGYSCRLMPEPEAADKHIAELRAQLGV